MARKQHKQHIKLCNYVLGEVEFCTYRPGLQTDSLMLLLEQCDGGVRNPGWVDVDEGNTITCKDCCQQKNTT